MTRLNSSLRRILTYASLRKCALIADRGLAYPSGAFGSLNNSIFRSLSSSSSYVTKPILPDVWEFQTQPFGKLIVEAPFHVEVRPLDPLTCPGQDRIQVTLNSDEEHLQPEWMEGIECQVDHDPKQHVLRVFGDLTERGHSVFPSLESLPVYLEVFIPLKYDVDILSHHHGRVSVKGLECANVIVKTESGMSNLGGLKAAKIQISSSFGDINVGGSLYGDVELITGGAGAINVHKVQGSLTASTDAGALWIKSAYLNRCALSSTGGDIRVTNLTGQDNVVESLHGDVCVDSVDGCLQTRTQTGNITATFSRVPTSPLVAGILDSDSGDIDLKVEAEVSATVFLAGEDVFVGEGLLVVDDVGDDASENVNVNSNANNNNDSHNNYDDLSLRQASVKVGVRESEAVIHAVSKLGQVTLAKKDWFGAFKFGS